MAAVYSFFVKRQLKAVIIALGIVAAILLLFVSLYPTIQDDATNFEELLQAFPDNLMTAFNITEQSYMQYEGFLSAEYYSFMWPIIIIVLAISLGTSALVGEIENGTIDTLLSQPISRTRLYIAKYAVGFSLLLIFSIISICMAVPVAMLFGVEYQAEHHLLLSLMATLFGMAIYSSTICLSLFFSTKGTPSAIAAGGLLMMYALDILAKLQTSVEGVRYISFFYYFDYSTILMSGELKVEFFLILLFASLIGFLGGLVLWREKDISV